MFQEFTWESLWGNAGGYIGFFLEISLMQLPQIILDIIYDCKKLSKKI